MELPSAITGPVDAAIDFIYSFGPLVEHTVVLVPDVLKAQVSNVADAAGMDIETVAYVLGMFACYPLGFVMAQIPYGTPRHIFFLPSWSLSPSVHIGSSMDSPSHQFLNCIRSDFGVTSQDSQDGAAYFGHDVHDVGSCPQAIYQLPWLGFGFHWNSNGFDTKTLHDRIQSL